ncbi:MAG: ferritin-like domain-containing protein [Tannerellaceae bacterium]|nr:ferritin-like domain-containing protein [Tannerellaceae bacterium]
MATEDKYNEVYNPEFHEFFLEELKDIYWAEQHLVDALEKLAEACTSPELAKAFEKHKDETQQHIIILEKVFGLLDEKAEAKKCKAMEGLLKEADTIIGDTEKDSFVRDAGLILAAQKVEHYEIATYGTLAIFAGYLENDEIAEHLRNILQNEKNTDVALTVLAENYINKLAAIE